MASRTAALNDDYADDSVGNITGSNSVNVFLGIGLPWLIGAVYWQAKGLPGMPVPYKDLGFSVLVFLGVALLCVLVLALRRRFFGYELGGKLKITSGLVLIGLWVLYITLCSLQAKGVITAVIAVGL